MNRFIRFIEGNIQGKKVFWLFSLTTLVYVFMLMVTIPKTMVFANGMKLLDMMPLGYDFNYVNDLFSSLGVQGRNTYLTIQIPVDMVYPFLFGLTYSLLLGFFLNKIHQLKSPLIYLCALPVIAGLADYLENFGVIVLLNTYPDLTAIEVHLTMIFSMLKSATSAVYFTVLIMVLLWFGVQSLFKVKKD
ncbi:hypothetical protein [Aestuariivivens sediminis]|uniref:hypothetical protein n=1 Tax=Aestuariivivens sediminis TaxID=2913557 RepID=UPI001F5A6BC8|nr:hypothetical protein [Aestuariivivens sediminis]